MEDTSIICDYVTLFIDDGANTIGADTANGLFVWNIPNKAYYFKDRGSVCLMSIADAMLPREVGENLVVMTQQGFNGMVSQVDSAAADKINSDLAVLGSFTNFTSSGLGTFETKYKSPQTIKLLTPAKPRQIKLQFFTEDKTPLDMSSAPLDNSGHVTIKFEYFNPERLNNVIYSQEYKPAF